MIISLTSLRGGCFPIENLIYLKTVSYLSKGILRVDYELHGLKIAWKKKESRSIN